MVEDAGHDLSFDSIFLPLQLRKNTYTRVTVSERRWTEFVLSNRPPFSTGSLNCHDECQLLSANGSDEFGQPSASQIPHFAQKLVPSLNHLNRSFKLHFIVTPPCAILLMFFFPSVIGLFLLFLLYCVFIGEIISMSFLNLHVFRMLNKKSRLACIVDSVWNPRRIGIQVLSSK